MFDYEMLRLVWWVLVGVLLIGFAITDGFDMGWAHCSLRRQEGCRASGDAQHHGPALGRQPGMAGDCRWCPVCRLAHGLCRSLLRLLHRHDPDADGPVLPPGRLQVPLLREDAKWRSNWDWALFVGSAVPPIVFGVAFGNLLQGVPFDFNQFMMLTYHGNFFGLLNPFGLLAGLVNLFMLVTQGATWLMMKTDGEVLARSRTAAMICSLLTLVLFGLAGFWVSGMEGYVVVKATRPMPFQSDEQGSGASGRSLDEQLQPLSWMVAAPVLGLAMSLLTALFAKLNKGWLAFTTSSWRLPA